MDNLSKEGRHKTCPYVCLSTRAWSRSSSTGNSVLRCGSTLAAKIVSAYRSVLKVKTARLNRSTHGRCRISMDNLSKEGRHKTCPYVCLSTRAWSRSSSTGNSVLRCGSTLAAKIVSAYRSVLKVKTARLNHSTHGRCRISMDNLSKEGRHKTCPYVCLSTRAWSRSSSTGNSVLRCGSTLAAKIVSAYRSVLKVKTADLNRSTHGRCRISMNNLSKEGRHKTCPYGSLE